jgi:hypothetical protein
MNIDRKSMVNSGKKGNVWYIFLKSYFYGKVGYNYKNMENGGFF